jgi:hypothetical protein
MRKEILFALLAGALFGLVIAFGVWKANTPVTSNESNTARQEETSASTAPSELAITLSQPNDYEVADEPTATVKGLTQPQAIIAVSGEEKDYILYADKSGSFEQDVALSAGINEIIITAFDKNGNSTKAKSIVIYSPEFIKEASGGSVYAQDSTKSSETIRQKVEEKVNQVLKSPRAYIGTVTDISETTIQINKFVFKPESEKSGEILQISTGDDTVFVSSKTSTRNIKRTDLAIGDFIIAMGYKNGNSVLEAKRISVIDTPQLTKRTSIMAEVKKTTSKDIQITPLNGDEIITIKSTKSLIVSYEKDQEIQKGNFSDIEGSDIIIISGVIDESGKDARSIHILPGESPIPSPSLSPSPKSTLAP